MSRFEDDLEEFVIWIGSIPLPEFLEVMEKVKDEAFARRVRIEVQKDRRAS